MEVGGQPPNGTMRRERAHADIQSFLPPARVCLERGESRVIPRRYTNYISILS